MFDWFLFKILNNFEVIVRISFSRVSHLFYCFCVVLKCFFLGIPLFVFGLLATTVFLTALKPQQRLQTTALQTLFCNQLQVADHVDWQNWRNICIKTQTKHLMNISQQKTEHKCGKRAWTKHGSLNDKIERDPDVPFASIPANDTKMILLQYIWSGRSVVAQCIWFRRHAATIFHFLHRSMRQFVISVIWNICGVRQMSFIWRPAQICRKLNCFCCWFAQFLLAATAGPYYGAPIEHRIGPLDKPHLTAHRKPTRITFFRQLETVFVKVCL